MDLYHSVHGHDVSTFDIQATHRLPAVSAAQALDDLDHNPSRCVSTGLRELDRALAAVSESEPQENGPGAATGVCRGQVTEIWGPPGVGKTAMGIQICASALSEGHGVVWVDCAYPTCGRRLRTVIEATRSDRPPGSSLKPAEDPETGPSDESPGDKKEERVEDGDGDRFVHYRCPTLSHLIALLCRPAASSLPSNAAVVVVDSLSVLLNEAFPKAPDGRKDFKSKGSGLSTRRLQTLQYVVSALQKLAATRNCAVVLLSQCATRVQSHSRGAALTPAINASVWEQGIGSRLVLFKDWLWKSGKAMDTCFAGVQRVAGKRVDGSLERIFAFRVGETGLYPVDYDDADQQGQGGAAKRKIGDAGLGIPDSDDEYGWNPDDEAHLPPEPPQWQGSEDLIVGTQRSDDDGSDEEGGDGEGEPA